MFSKSINAEGVRRTKYQEKLRKVHYEKHWDCEYSPNKMMVPLPKNRNMGGVDVKYGWGERERKKHRGLRWLKLKGRHHFEELGVAGRIILKRILKELDEKA